MSENKEEPDYDKLQKQWEEELKTNPKVQAYLEKYKKSDWDSMYKQYAFQKMLAFKNADHYKKRAENAEGQWIKNAYQHLETIQQKKLFDAQCRWRAGLEEYEAVEICFDFKVWENDVLNCPFIEPPNEYDIELYRDFLSQDYAREDSDDRFDSEEWQDYDGLKEAYNNNEENKNMPEWYDFHNSRTGNGILLTLPDVRGQLEEFYKDLARKENQKSITPPQTYQPDPDAGKPFLQYYDKRVLLDFAKQIENKEMLSIFKTYVDATEHLGVYENERASEDFHYLSTIKDELIPIEAHQDYRIGLYLAYKKYRFKKIAENLPLALEQYRREASLREMGIDAFVDKGNFRLYLDLRKFHTDGILLGRKLNNEPQDFNF